MGDKSIWEILVILMVFVMVTSNVTLCTSVDDDFMDNIVLSSSSVGGVPTSDNIKLYLTVTVTPYSDKLHRVLREYPYTEHLIAIYESIFNNGDYLTWDNYFLKGDISGTSYSYLLYLKSSYIPELCPENFSSTTFKIEIFINGATVATFPLLTVPYDPVAVFPYVQPFSGTVTGLDPSTSSGDEVTFKITKISGDIGGIKWDPGTSYITIPPLAMQTIQSKIDAAKLGDTIIIEDGIYNENVKVNKQLTIRSKNGPDKTIVQAATSEDPVFTVTTDFVNINGFTMAMADTGIHLYNADYCNISNNTCSCNNVYGIDLKYSNNNSIFNNTCSNNTFGIYLNNSSNNLITNNNVSNNSRVITVDNPTIDDDLSWITVGPITATWGEGISLYNSSNNKINLNNFINNYDNVDPSDLTNIWDSPERITYTYNGTTYESYLGNYWDDYEGTDAEGDGIGDTPYIIVGDKDNYPLMEPFESYFTCG